MTNRNSCGNIYKHEIKCECSSMVEFQPSKLVAWVRFPSLAPIIRALSSVDRVPGYEPVGRRFESSRARHKGRTPQIWGVFSFPLCRALSDSNIARETCEGSHIPPEDRQARFSGAGCGYIHVVNTLQGAPSL